MFTRWGQRWSKEDKARLRAEWKAWRATGANIAVVTKRVAAILGRSPAAVLRMATQLWLPTRRTRRARR